LDDGHTSIVAEISFTVKGDLADGKGCQLDPISGGQDF
jgi:hypothetical protein